HPAGAYLERADLVPAASGLPDRPFAGAGRKAELRADPWAGGGRPQLRWNDGAAAACRKRAGVMTRRLDVINLEAPPERPEPAMPSACLSGGCGGPDEAAMLPPLPAYGEVRVNSVE